MGEKRQRRNERIRRKDRKLMEMHVTLQGVLTKGEICDIDVWFVYNSTIIFFKNAAEHKTRGNVKR